MDFDDFTTRYTAAWNSGDPAQVAAFFAPDKGIIINRGEEHFGQKAVTAVAADFMSSFPDLAIIRDFHRLAGDHGLFGWTLEGHHSETGNLVKASGWEEWNLNDAGQITLSLGWFDAVDYTAQVEGHTG